jgi:hypothetical protein
MISGNPEAKGSAMQCGFGWKTEIIVLIKDMFKVGWPLIIHLAVLYPESGNTLLFS